VGRRRSFADGVATKARCKIPFGFRRGDGGELVEVPVEQELSEKWSRCGRRERRCRLSPLLWPPRAHRISHEGVAGVLRLEGIVAPLVFDGPINAQVFEAYVEQWHPTLWRYERPHRRRTRPLAP
jgi:hypothetical protein